MLLAILIRSRIRRGRRRATVGSARSKLVLSAHYVVRSKLVLSAHYVVRSKLWRVAHEPDQQGRFTLNTLEFMAAVIGPWIDLIEGRRPPLSCILGCTDSTVGAGWLHRSNFRERGWHDGKATMETAADVEVKVAVARTYATILLDAEAMLYPQWFAGKLKLSKRIVSLATPISPMPRS